MAMATTLLLVGARDLAKLEAQPTWINRFRAAGTYSTYYYCSLNYFVAGDAWPAGSRKRPLGGMLYGFRSVTCPTLECGNFGVLEPAEVPLVLAAFAKLDLAAIREAVEHADSDDLEEEEVDDFELLLEDDDAPADALEADLRSLIAFYKRAARGRYGIVSYTT
jgi:hypothetical protein